MNSPEKELVERAKNFVCPCEVSRCQHDCISKVIEDLIAALTPFEDAEVNWLVELLRRTATRQAEPDNLPVANHIDSLAADLIERLYRQTHEDKKRIAELGNINNNYRLGSAWKDSDRQELLNENESLRAKVSRYEKALKHLWRWLPIRYRNDYLSDYPTQRDVIEQLKQEGE